MFLSAHGVPSVLADRHPAASVQGRARGINQRTMELYRPLGLEPALLEAARPFAADSGVARCQTLSGEWEWLFDPEPDPAAALASPAAFCMADQNTVEPLLRAAAGERGADLRLDTEVTDVSIEPDGVSAVLADTATGRRSAVRADYLIAADGHASPLRGLASINRTGPGVTQHWVSIVIDADLGDVITKRALFWIVLNEQLGFASFVTTATPGRWAVSVTYDPRTTSVTDFTGERCVQIARAALGRDDIAMTVVSVAAWEQAVGVADAYRSGRVFLAGDAADQARAATGSRIDAYRVGTDLGDPEGAWSRFALPDGAAALARPDGYVAWIGERAGPGLAAALGRLLRPR